MWICLSNHSHFCLWLWGAFGEPAFADALALLEYFAYAPERREGHHTAEYRKHLAFNSDRGRTTGDTENKEHPPDAHSKVVLAFDYSGVENSYNKKGGKAYYKTHAVIFG